eukprot:506594-Rhodomonas_salina.1
MLHRRKHNEIFQRTGQLRTEEFMVPWYPGTIVAQMGLIVGGAFVPAHSLPAVVGKSYHKLYQEITAQIPLQCGAVWYKPKRPAHWVRRRIATAYGVSIDETEKNLGNRGWHKVFVRRSIHAIPVHGFLPLTSSIKPECLVQQDWKFVPLNSLNS